MRKKLLIVITIAIVILFAIAKVLVPLNAKEARLEAQKQENIEQWITTSIYDISIIDGVKYYNGKEILCSYPLEDAINYIIDSNSVSYGDYDIEVKYISSEDLYIANIKNFIHL